MSARQASLFGSDDLPDNLTPWEKADEADRLLAEVVIDRPLSRVFHYSVPSGLREILQPGQRVEVPFGRGDTPTTGFCVGLTTDLPAGRTIKSLLAVLDREPLVSAHLLQVTHWLADHYLCGWGQVLQAIIPAGVKSQAGTREVTFFQVSGEIRQRWPEVKASPKQSAVLKALMEADRPLAVDELAQRAGCGLTPIQALRERGWIIAQQERRLHGEEPPMEAREPHEALQLTIEQQHAIQAILSAVRSRQPRTLLLHGVTGSGKTEVYIQAIEEVVSYGRQAIVLVPEISLTPQTIRRFRSRFPSVAVLHSHLSDRERHLQWRQIAEGRVQVVVGARSAVFAPAPQLGLIVIDEEHETSFKQETTPRYHAPEVARQRSELLGIPLLLGTATPTLETWLKVDRKEIELLSLPRRVGRRPLPPVAIINTSEDATLNGPQPKAIGRMLRNLMQKALQDQGQIILFLNVRGYAPVVFCRACGQSLKCPDCELTLTWHKEHQRAVCHSCGHETVIPQPCPHCQRPGFRYFGIGTERLEHEVQELFPAARVLRMDSDTMKARGSHATALDKFRHGEVEILLGTQMIAKGLDFPRVTLVGVIDADTALRQPDLRARERTFQLLAQVAGRTGRGDLGGRVVVQTASPQDPAILFASRHDYLGFARQELQERKLCRSVPFESAVRIILRATTEALVDAESQRLAELLRKTAKDEGLDVRLMGPAPCLHARLQKYYRYHIQIQAPQLSTLQLLWRQTDPQFQPAKGLDFVVDVEPISFR